MLGGGYTVEVEADGGEGVSARLAALPGVRNVAEPAAGRWRITCDRDLRGDAAAVVVAAGGRLHQLSLDRPSLETIYTRYFQEPQEECRMRREGSPWQGLGVVVLKELSDHFGSVRMRVLEWLVVLTALAAVYGAIQQIRAVTAEDPFLFLHLFTTAREPLPSFVSFLAFLVPLMAIGLGFDAVNGEHNRRTLSRILSQPIYRDALLFGKFIAALTTLAVSLIALWLLVIGLGIIMLGVPPGGEEMARAFMLLVVDHRLCRRVAGAGDAVLDHLPLGRDGGAGDARPVAVPDRDLAGAGAGDRRGGGVEQRSGDARHHRADAGAAVAVDLVRRMRAWPSCIRRRARSGRSISTSSRAR